MTNSELVQLLIDQGFIKARGHKNKYYPESRKNLEPKYDPKYQDIIYFCLDTYEILLNGHNYGGDLKGIHQNILESYDPDTADTYVIEKNTEDDMLQLTFTPVSPAELTVPVSIGDIAQGTKASELNGTALSKILDDILFKTIYPTVTNPSVSISGSPGTSEAGSALYTGYTKSFNKGNVKVDDGVTRDIPYVGDEIKTTFYVTKTASAAVANAGTSTYPAVAKTDVTIFNVDGRYEPGSYTYSVEVDYAEGPLMKTSKGASPNPMPTTNAGNVTNPHPPGRVTSGTITKNITLPLWVDDAGGEYVKQALKAWGTFSYELQMKATNAGNPIRVRTPRKINTINSYNPVSGKYDVVQKGSFSMDTITWEVNGADYTYYEYKWTGGTLDAVKFQIVTY